MYASNQQTLPESLANERPPMPKIGNYIPWESRFRRFPDNKLEDGEQLWRLIEKGPFVRPMILDPDCNTKQSRAYASPSYSNSPQQYYVTHLSLGVDYEKDYQGELQGDSQEGQSIQTIHMLGKTPNKVYDPFLKVGMGYQNPECLKKAIAAQPKMCHGEMLQNLFLGDKIEAGTTATTLTAKLHILNLGEYDLCLMRIKQYFLMTDYSLWEVIKNGNKVLTKTVGTVEQIYEPTSVDEKLDRKNEMKARGILMMALPNKDQLKFHSYQDAKLLLKAIEKRYGGNKESKKVQRTLLKQQYENFAASSSETLDQTFDSSKESRNKGRGNGRKTFPVENPTENALIAQDEIKEYDWSCQTEEEHPTNNALMALTFSGSSSSSDFKIDSCSKTCLKAYATLKEQYDSLSSDYKKSQFNVVSYKAGLQSVEERLVHYKKNEAVFADKINILNIEVRLRDNSLVEYTKKLEKSSDKVKTGLGYKETSPAKESFVKSSEMLENQENVKSRSDKGYDVIPLPYTGNYIPPKPDLMFIDEQVKSESVGVISNVSSSAVKTVELKLESVDVKIKGNPQQNEYKEKGVIDRGCSRHMTGNKYYLTNYKDYDGGFVSFGDGKGRISRKGKIKTRTLNFDDVYFCKELKYNMFSMSQICNKKNNVLFTDTECLVLSSNFKLVDESQVLLRVPRKDNKYSVDLKSVVPTGGLTCLFAKATTDESKLWHMRLGHINYKTMNKLMRGKLMREAINIACYVLNRALVIKPHNKTPYELIRGRPSLIDFMKPFGCLVTILNTRDYLGKFDEKADEGFFVAYSMLLQDFKLMVLQGTKDNIVAGQAEKKKEPEQEYIVIPICTTDPLISQGPKDSAVDVGKKATKVYKSQVSDNGRLDDQITRIAKIEAIRLFLAYASFKDFVVYQMDIKSDFLYGKIEEEVYVCQLPGFEDPDFPDKVYKVEKALYGLHQVPKACSPVNTVGPSFVNATSPSPINDAGTPASTYASENILLIDFLLSKLHFLFHMFLL
nr:ribonuclease H-like domain-containing protein [Tanacetum cinerariifolium]